MASDGKSQNAAAPSMRTIAALLDQAEQRQTQGQYTKAIALAQEAVDQIDSVSTSSDRQAWMLARASEVLDNADEHADAVLACRRALRRTPSHAYASYVAARALEHLGQFSDAESLLDSALAHHPDDLDLTRLKADLLTVHGAHDDAASRLRRVVQERSQDKVAWFNLSNALLQLHRYTEALDAAEHAIALAAPPQVADAWVNKGRALKGLGQDASAITAFQEAVRMNRAQLQAHYHLAQLYQRHGQRMRAWRERLFTRLLNMLYRARRYAEAQLHRKQLRMLGLDE